MIMRKQPANSKPSFTTKPKSSEHLLNSFLSFPITKEKISNYHRSARKIQLIIYRAMRMFRSNKVICKTNKERITNKFLM